MVNTASIAGKRGEPWLSVYSATKAGVVGFTQAMNKELGRRASSPALCPAFVDTPMADFVKGDPGREMIRPDIAEAVAVLRLSPGCAIPEICSSRREGDPAGSGHALANDDQVSVRPPGAVAPASIGQIPSPVE